MKVQTLFSAAAVSLSLVSVSAFANSDSIKVNCGTPRMMAGAPLVTLKGELKLEDTAEGTKASGPLALNIRTLRAVIFSGNVNMIGGYVNNRIAVAATLGSPDTGMESATFYVNFTNAKVSSIELNGQTYKMDCTL